MINRANQSQIVSRTSLTSFLFMQIQLPTSQSFWTGFESCLAWHEPGASSGSSGSSASVFSDFPCTKETHG